MGQRKVIIKETVADNIAAIAWYIESKGLLGTADKFVDDVYDYFQKLSDQRKSYAICAEPKGQQWDINVSPITENIQLPLLNQMMN